MFLQLFKIRAQAWISQFGKGKNGRISSGRMLVFAALFIYVGVVFIGMFAGIFRSLLMPVREAGLDWLYFSIGGVMAFLLAFIGSVFSVWNQLFDSRDNDALLSMPIRPRDILASRLFMLLVMNLVLSLAIMIPVIVVWMGIGRSAGIVNFIICALAVPFLALTVSTVIGFLVGLAISRFKRKNIFRVVLTVVVLVVYFNFIINGQRIMENMLGNIETLAQTARTWLFPFYHFGLAISEGNWLSTLIFLICTAIPFAIVVAVVSKAYVGALTMKKGSKTKKYKGGKIKARSPREALFTKELRRFSTNPMILLNAGLGSIGCVVLIVIMAVKNDAITGMFSMYPVLGGNLGFMVAGLLCLVLSINQISASSISLEGKSLWIPRTLPVETGVILNAKVKAHFVYSAVPAAICAVVAVVLLKIHSLAAPFVILMPVAFALFSAYKGLLMNLHFPNLNWINEVSAVKQGAGILLSMIIDWVSIGIMFILFFIMSKIGLPDGVVCIIATVIYAAAAFFARRRMMKTGGEKFENL